VNFLQRSVRTAIKTDLSYFEHVRPIRSALVILGVLATAYSRNDVRALLPLGVGMLFAAIADRGTTLQRRMTSMVGALVAVTFGTAVGGLVSANQILHVSFAGFVGLICGLVGVASIPSMTAGILGLVVFTIFSGSPIDLLDWKTNALLMLLGASIMCSTVIAEFAVRALLGRQPTLRGELADESYWTRASDHLHWSDQIILHSIRLGIVIMIATMLEEILSFPHSYWIPMTVAWIARPDRDGTVEKVTLRVAGTLLGVAIAGALLAITPATKYRVTHNDRNRCVFCSRVPHAELRDRRHWDHVLRVLLVPPRRISTRRFDHFAGGLNLDCCSTRSCGDSNRTKTAK